MARVAVDRIKLADGLAQFEERQVSGGELPSMWLEIITINN
jgi:hypothetical protein